MMTIDLVQTFLGWCLVFNMGILLLWISMLSFGRQWIFRLHGNWWPMTEADFSRVHYQLYGGYKLLILLFNAVPYIVLQLIER